MPTRPQLTPLRLAAALLAGLAGPGQAFAARTSVGQERGHPPLHVFPHSALPLADPVVQFAGDAEGVLYLASGDAVFEFDGINARALPPLTPGAAVHDLAFDSKRSRLIVTQGETLGVLERSEGGWRTRAVPLPAEVSEILPFARVIAAHGEVYLGGRGVLGWLEGGDRWVSLPVPSGASVYSLPAEGEALAQFVHEDRIELLLLRGGRAEQIGAVPRGAGGAFARFAHRLPDGGWRLVLERGELLTLRNGTVAPWPAPLAADLRGVPLSGAASLPGGGLALGTPRDGVLCLDAHGNVFAAANAGAGLPVDRVDRLRSDPTGRLWVAAGEMVAVIDGLPGLTVFDRYEQLLGGATLAIARHAGALYAGTEAGVYRMQPGDSDTPAQFVHVPGLAGRCRALVAAAGELFAASRAGIHRLEGAGFRLLAPSAGVTALIASPEAGAYPVLYYGTSHGLGRLVRTETGWQAEPAQASYGDVASLVPVAGGGLLVTRSRGAVTLFSPAGRSRPSPTTAGHRRLPLAALGATGAPASAPVQPSHFGPAHGVPERSGRSRLFFWEGDPVLATETALLRYDAESGQFSPLPIAGWRERLIGARVEAIAPSDDGSGAAWASIRPNGEGPDAPPPQLVRIVRDGRTPIEVLPAAILAAVGEVAALRYEPAADGGVLWVGGTKALGRVEPGRLAAPAPPPRVRWRELPAAVAAGAPLPHDHPPLRLEFSAPAIPAGMPLEYQTRLDGEWSPFSRENARELGRLRPGSYRFEVRARDAHGRLGPAAAIAFRVRPAWWLSPWAWAGYALAGAAAIAAVVRWRWRGIRRRNAELERIVSERTGRLRASEQHLLVARDAAESANRAKSAFLASMSHELRTPLNSILGYTQIMQRTCPPGDPNARRLELVTRSGEHLLRLINDLLDLSRIEAGRIDLQPRPCALRRLLAELAELFQARAAQKGLGFSFSQPLPVPEWALADEHRLRQILSNLLGNAVKFTERGEIAFLATPLHDAAGTIRFEVRDTGSGIAPADLARIFAPFQQAASPALAAQGAGLGLAISDRLVQLMHGRLHVESAPGQGSRFWFELPLPATVAPALATAGARTISGYRGNRRRLLVVDDEPGNRELLRDLLGGLGFDVTVAPTGMDALAACKETRFDAVLLDLRLPGLDGYTLAPRLRAASAAPIRILALSASVFPIDCEQAIAAGCDEFLPKPIHEPELFAALGRLLGLDWIHAPATAPTADSGTPFELLAPPSTAALDELLEAIAGGDALGVNEKLNALRLAEPHAAAFVARLTVLASNFQMAALSAAVRSARERAAGPRTPAPTSA